MLGLVFLEHKPPPNTRPVSGRTPSRTNMRSNWPTILTLNNNALDVIQANLKSQPLTLDLFDIVKSPSGGSTVFEVPELTGIRRIRWRGYRPFV